MSIQHATDDTFEQLVLKNDKPVVVDFWAAWCGPCRFISPIFEKLSDSDGCEGIGFYKVDVDEQEQISQEVSIRAVCYSFSFWWTEVIVVTGSQMPTFIVFQGGQKVNEIVGADQGGLQVGPSIIWSPSRLQRTHEGSNR